MISDIADSTRLLGTPAISEPDSSSQHSSYTLTINSEDELHRTRPSSCGPGQDPRQTACQHTSDAQSTTSGARLPRLSHEDSNGNAHHSTEDSIMDARANLMHDGGGRKFPAVSTRRYPRITKSPLQSRNTQPGKLLKRVRHGPDCLSETLIESSKTLNVLNLWKWEILNCVLAIGMIGSMCIILLHYDGQSLPDWGSAINLSTLIALMATILRTMLAFVASEIIGQAKWNHLASVGRSEQIAPLRQLIETSRFNDASQGLLGAVKLLPTIIRDPATLTAVMVMIVSLGTGSFVQQAIQTQSCQFPMDNAYASLPIVRNVTGGTKREGDLQYFDDSSPVAAAAQLALAPESEELGSPISVECSTGNCTFDNPISGIYSTLGLCSMCADTSPLIRRERMVLYDENTGLPPEVSPAWYDLFRNYTLPNGMSVQATAPNDSSGARTELLASPDRLGLDWAGDLVSSEMTGLSQWALANITILAPILISTSPGYTDYVAATCTLYYCLRSYNASVKSGKLKEVLVSTVPAVPNVADWFPSGEIEEAVQNDTQADYWESLVSFSPHQAIQSPCLVDDTIWTRENKSSTVNMERLLLLHVDPDTSRGRHFTIEDTTAPAECIYRVKPGEDSKSYSESYSALSYLFDGSCNASLWTSDSYEIPTISCDQTYWLARFYSDKGATAAMIIERIKAFTDRFSNKMRMGLLNNPETVSGQVLQMAVCSRIQYSWLAFPAVLVAVTNGLLAWTIFQSSRRRGRVMVWKTSILPFLFYSEQFVVQNAEDVSGGSSESLRRDECVREPLLDLDQMEAEARQRKVRFEVFD